MAEIVKKNPVNDPTQKSVKTHSKFEPNYSRYDTHVFGLNTPHFVMGAVADDDISMRSQADVDTFNLKAPLMMPVRRNMDYFQLPMRALLPRGAEYIITNPLTGEDIDALGVNAIISAANLNRIAERVRSSLTSGAPSDQADMLKQFLNSYLLYTLFFSPASLPKYLGYSFDKALSGRLDYFAGQESASNYLQLSLDLVYDTMLNRFDDKLSEGGYIEVSLAAPSYSVNAAGQVVVSVDSNAILCQIGQINAPSDTVKHFATFRQFIEFLLGSCYVVSGCTVSSALVTNPDFFPFVGVPVAESISSYLAEVFLDASVGYTQPYLNISFKSFVKPHNLLRLVAYQKACAEFYTNDKVDGIYSAALWEANQIALFRYLSTNNYFTVNGVPVEYDASSGVALNAAATRLEYALADSPQNLIAYCYFHNLLGFTRSLKYEDYFVGAKTRPLAVGDVTVGVDTAENTVDIIDVTKKIQVQRFLNQVNRIGRKFSDYVKGILGDKPMKDVHEPIFLGHVVDTFGAEETDNTGEGQLSLPNSTTSKMRNNSSRFGFDVHVGEPSILIGITNYDIPRVYESYTDKENFHIDRYDMFNPFMQFVGDQAVENSEINPSRNGNFGYTMRYMEYKQKVDQCSGGFVAGALPGYARVLRVSEIPENIDSDFIRSRVGEIDEFYSVLSGYSPAFLFQFIVRVDNSITARRPMAFAPSIL